MELSYLFYKCAYTIPYSEVGDGVNYAFEEIKNTLYIYFQGSSQATDWVRNFLFGKRPYKDMEIPYRVHRGFLAAWKEVEDIIKEKIQEKIPNSIEYKWKKIVVVGYSHGGALAGFCHECVWYNRPDLREKGLQGFGFEAPRFYAGWKVKEKLKERWVTFKVIRNNSDVVTHCPPWILGYHHVGEIFKIHGDRKLVENKMPCFVKDHYPQCVYDGLKKEEND